MLARRSFLLGLTSTLAAPAIVRAGSLMPVRAIQPVFSNRVMRALIDIQGLKDKNMLWRIEWQEVSNFLLPDRLVP